jgi:hypothetical protein
MTEPASPVTIEDFARIEMVVGTVSAARPHAKARNPSVVLEIDPGVERGTILCSDHPALPSRGSHRSAGRRRCQPAAAADRRRHLARPHPRRGWRGRRRRRPPPRPPGGERDPHRLIPSPSLDPSFPPSFRGSRPTAIGVVPGASRSRLRFTQSAVLPGAIARRIRTRMTRCCSRSRVMRTTSSRR